MDDNRQRILLDAAMQYIAANGDFDDFQMFLEEAEVDLISDKEKIQLGIEELSCMSYFE